MADSTSSFRVKVEAVFRELAGDRAASLGPARSPESITPTITAALIAKDAAPPKGHAQRVTDNQRNNESVKNLAGATSDF